MMDLDILAGSDMDDIVLRILVKHTCNGVELIGVAHPPGYLYADHMHAFLALTINPLLQADRLEAVGIDMFGQEGMQRLFVAFDFFVIYQCFSIIHYCFSCAITRHLYHMTFLVY